ncbi:MAG: acyl carrier protein [Dehalococcoidia bacterium]|nr:acyl carrier protein [Dehalococcoidia bacterium]
MIGGDGSLDAIAQRVRAIVADIAGVDPASVAEHTPLFDAEDGAGAWALDSLDSLKLALALAEEYGLDDDPEIDYQHLQTVREIAQYIHGLHPGGES